MDEATGRPWNWTKTIWDIVETAASERPDDVVLTDDHGRSLTTVALRAGAETAAAGLHGLGVRSGEVVSWQLPTVLEAPVLLLALARLGAVQNPLIPLLREREVAMITQQIDTRLLVVPESWRGFDHGDMARALDPDVVALDLEGPVPADLRLPGGDASALPPPTGDLEACRWIYYSSGTTAVPKGARHTDLSVAASSNGVVDFMEMRRGDVYPVAWPIAHIGGIAMLTAALRTGATLALFDTFDATRTPARMAAQSPTVLGSATPFFMAYMAYQRELGDEPAFPRLRACVGGGAPIPQEVNREVAEVLGVAGVHSSWGLTEFPVATSETMGDPMPGTTVGFPVAGVSVRVVDGELRLKGPNAFLGYVDRSLDSDAFDDDGWFRTGDLGSIDDDGRVRVEGRLKDVIIRNAENVSAQEVEEVVLAHPAVADAAVIGLPHPRTGEQVCAVVVLHGDRVLDVPLLAQHCKANGLAAYKLPERIEILEELPRNSMGKVLKADLRKQLT